MSESPSEVVVDYWGLREGLSEAIRSYPGLESTPVHLEPADELPPESLPCVCIFLVERTSPGEIQRIAAGQRTDHTLVFSIWCLAYSVDAMAVAVRQRDDLLAKVEVALMRDRFLRGRLAGRQGVRLRGGEVQSGRDPRNRAAFATAIETLVFFDVFTNT